MRGKGMEGKKKRTKGEGWVYGVEERGY